MYKLVAVVISVFFLASCTQKDIAEDISFNIAEIEENVPFGAIYKINKKESESAILRMSDDKLLFGVQDRTTRDFSFYWTGLDLDIEKTKSLAVSEEVGNKADELYLGIEGYKELGVVNDKTIETIGLFNFSGVYFDLFNNNLSENFRGTVELENGKQQAIFKSKDNSVESNVLITWGKDGEIEKRTVIKDILGDLKAECDSIGVFGEYTYMFSNETKKMYQLTSEAKLVETYDLSEYFTNGNIDQNGQFIYQQELGKCIFSVYEKDSGVHYFDVGINQIKPWDFSDPIYQDKYAVLNSAIIDLGNSKESIIYLDSNKVFDSGGMGFSENGDLYFLSNRNLSQEKPKKEKLYIRYLVKVDQDKLKSFLEVNKER
ncbi:hypothetical protein L6D60_002592 [Listeria monocytogenes]|nr:hypothetical protein [Listeria monocytogenes]